MSGLRSKNVTPDVRISVRRIGVHGYDPMWEASLMIGDKAAFRRVHENRDVAERDLAEDIDRMALALGFAPDDPRQGHLSKPEAS